MIATPVLYKFELDVIMEALTITKKMGEKEFKTTVEEDLEELEKSTDVKMRFVL